MGAASWGAARASVGSRGGEAPVQRLREVPQLRQEVAQVDLVVSAQGAALGKEKHRRVSAQQGSHLEAEGAPKAGVSHLPPNRTTHQEP